MAVANTLFGMLTTRYNEAMLLADDIYLQISSLKRSTDNAELDRLHTLYHHAHDAPATGEEQKIALMLVCPGFNACSNPCVVGKVCEVYTYVSWNSGDDHKRECGWALYHLQAALHEYFACGAVQRGSVGWNGRFETWQDLLAYHVLGMQLVNFFLFNPIFTTFWVYTFCARGSPAPYFCNRGFCPDDVAAAGGGQRGARGNAWPPPRASASGWDWRRAGARFTKQMESQASGACFG